MANNQPNVDPDIEALRGKVPGIESELENKEVKVPKEEPKAPEPKAPEPKKEEKAPEAPAKEVPPKDEKKPEVPPVVTPPKVDAAPNRPLKYIPIKQYTAEKEKWQEDKARLAEFEKAANAAKGSKESDDAIKAYAEEYGVTEDSVRGLIGVFTKMNPPKETTEAPKPEISPEDQALIEEANLIKANKLFEEEYASLAVPQFKALYPDATPEQIASAKQQVEELACSEGFLDKSLDFVVFKNRQLFDKVFEAPRTGPDSGRQAPERTKSEYTPADFKDGKTSFEVLLGLPAEEQNKIIDAMDIQTYAKFAAFNESNQDLVIRKVNKK